MYAAKSRTKAAAGLAAICLVSVSSSAQDDLQAQIEAQGNRIDELEEELYYSQEDEGGSFDELFGKVDIHGFLAQGYMNSSANNYLTRSDGGSWAFHEVGINFSVDLDERTRAGIQLFSRDLGPTVDSRVIVDWAMLSYHWDDLLGLRFGKIKVPFGLYNETRDVEVLRNSILLPQSVYSEPYRDALGGLWGVGLYGGLGDGDLGHLEYELQIGTNDEVNNGPIASTFEDFLPMDVDSVEMDYSWGGGLRWITPLEGLDLNATLTTTNIDSTGTLNQNLGGPLVPGTPTTYDISDALFAVFSAQYTWEDLILATEYFQSTLPTELTADLGGGTAIPISDTTGHQQGYYLSAAYRFTDWFELGSYYSVYYPNSDDRDGVDQVARGDPAFKAWSKDFALTARFDIDDNWVFKLEGHAIDGVAGLLNELNPDGYTQHWNLFVAKLAVSF